MPEFNLDLIKQEIESRKSEQFVTEQVNGTGKMGAPRDSKRFLVDLLQSVNQGAPTPSVQALRMVTETSDAIYGVPTTVGRPAPQIQQAEPSQQFMQQPHQQYGNQPQHLNENFMGGGMTGDRGADAYFEQQLQQGMDLLRQRANRNGQPAPGLGQALTEYNTGSMMQPQEGINMSMLNEHISNSANFQKLVEGAYKNMINEMFAKEKIENALVEIVQGDPFKKLLKKTIVDTLVEIQNRNKKAS